MTAFSRGLAVAVSNRDRTHKLPETALCGNCHRDGAHQILRVFRTQPEPPETPAAWANELLYRLSRLEQTTWGRLPIPGSSLMVLGGNLPKVKKAKNVSTAEVFSQK